jgi:hypothetical protein
VVFFEKYCQYSDFLTLESHTEVGVGVLVHVTSLVPVPEDAELTERSKVGFEPKGWLSFNVDAASGWCRCGSESDANCCNACVKKINVTISPIYC